MFSRMSVSASRVRLGRVRLESINCVALDVRPDERLQTAAVGDIDTDREEARDVLRNPNIFEKPDWRLRGELDQNIDIARALALGTRDGANNAAWRTPRRRSSA